jgi:hypothetical protein
LLAPLQLHDQCAICNRPRRHRHLGATAYQNLKPIDEADRIDDWLYLPETLYAFMLILVISAGAGPYRLVILGLIHPEP